MMKINHISPILPLLMMSTTVISMDLASKKIIVNGTLFIDKKQPVLCHENNHAVRDAVEYLPPRERANYPCAERFALEPLGTPFVKILMALDSQSEKIIRSIIPSDQSEQKIKFIMMNNTRSRNSIRTIIPAHKLINCNNGSCIQLETPQFIFDVTCAKNNALVVSEKYFPQGEEFKGLDNFETQFLSCMNKFYAKQPYCSQNLNLDELLKEDVLQCHSMLQLVLRLLLTREGVFMRPVLGNINIYTHGKNGCSTDRHLLALATHDRTNPYGNNKFDYVMGRQIGKASPKVQSINPLEAKKLQFYYHHLEHGKKAGDKSPMMTNSYQPKKPSLDIPDKQSNFAQDTEVINEHLSGILDDCLQEMMAQDSVADKILDDCLVEFEEQEKAKLKRRTRHVGGGCALL